MRNIIAVFKRELKSYFSSQIIYVISAVFMLVIGSLFRQAFFEFASRSMRILQYQYNYGSGNVEFINVNSVSLGLFNYINFIFLLIIPLLTMRLYSEEKKSGTIELLMTSPITSMEIMIGKFLSCFSVYSIMLFLTAAYMVILAIQSHGQLDLRPIISSYAGTFLFGAAIIPIGMFFSSTTENQIVAGFTTISAGLALWILVFSAPLFSPPFDSIVSFLSPASHLDFFKLGMFGLEDIVYFLSMSLFWLVLTWMSVESTRWRQ